MRPHEKKFSREFFDAVRTKDHDKARSLLDANPYLIYDCNMVPIKRKAVNSCSRLVST